MYISGLGLNFRPCSEGYIFRLWASVVCENYHGSIICSGGWCVTEKKDKSVSTGN